jgi:hypothetical protein
MHNVADIFLLGCLLLSRQVHPNLLGCSSLLDLLMNPLVELLGHQLLIDCQCTRVLFLVLTLNNLERHPDHTGHAVLFLLVLP